MYGGERVSKSSRRIAAIGYFDELNAQLGVARSLIRNDISLVESSGGGGCSGGGCGAGGGCGSGGGCGGCSGGSCGSGGGAYDEILQGLLNLDEILKDLQNTLFKLGADIATPQKTKAKVKRIETDDTKALEKKIDMLEKNLNPLTEFILPSGCQISTTLHLARTVCRRAERSVVKLREEIGDELNSEILAFANRVSDLLFVMARSANSIYSFAEEPWENAD